MTLNKIRSYLYVMAKYLGDIQAVYHRKICRRILVRLTGKLTGRIMGRLFK